ncbi:MAG: hypothetical protein DRN71_04150 [Candidatus Nanohalarchaeota archaeon]|nr:MAG: hypothetical protein DRN71_04150 [Candidatus Nanohaloarchaeota archaeon]
MIERILPLTKNRIEILRLIYDAGETHLLDISKNLGLHPYSVQKTLSFLKPVLEQKKHGKTIVLKINTKLREREELFFIIEDYKVGCSLPKVKTVVNNVQMFFSGDKNILACCLFGSYARGGINPESDVDLLFVVSKSKGEDEILKGCRDISGVIGCEINPVIMSEKEFFSALKERKPMIETILKPSQRLILIGKEYFLRNTFM